MKGQTLSRGHWKDAGTFPPPMQRSWTSVSQWTGILPLSQSLWTLVQWRRLECQYVRVVVILVNTATYSTCKVPQPPIPCPSPPFPPPHLATNQMLYRNCPADTLLQEVIMVRHLLHKVLVSLYHKSTTCTHSVTTDTYPTIPLSYCIHSHPHKWIVWNNKSTEMANICQQRTRIQISQLIVSG